ncbi:MAG: purine-nucleoside phosphorylase [Elusimicrobiales bacterium]|jgi:purine-nucleoside phosphorylase|nr:purine-nucleoside phosphorylase [Elusimicrobiales bacterium]
MKNEDRFTAVRKTADWLLKKTGGFRPETAIIAGSGLANALPDLAGKKTVPYGEIPGFPGTTVKGHKGELVFGTLGGRKVVIMRGRFHYYESGDMAFIAFPVRVLAALGVKNLLVTAAVGSLSRDLRPGDIMALRDHINMMGTNPLIGNHHEGFGAMFPDMNDPYDAALRRVSLKLMRSAGMKPREGVYFAVSGPTYETPAEVKLYKQLGGSVVGMSVVPEVITARQLKLRVAGLCWISNFASGISKEVLDHADVLALGEKVSVKMKKLLEGLVKAA